MKIALASFFALLALALLYLATRDSGAAARTSQAEIAREVEPAPREPSELATPVTEVSLAPELEKRTALQETPAATAAEEPEAATRLQGSVLFIDDAGTEYAELNGEITFLRWVDDSTARVTSKVERGTFEFEAAEGLELTVEKLTLNDLELVLNSPDWVYVVAEGPVVVRAIEQLQLRLSVLDARAGAHLSNVTVLAHPGWGAIETGHPGTGNGLETIATNGVSPVPVHPAADSHGSHNTTYLVHSPGFAWKAVQLDLSQGGAREVKLELGGDLTIRIVGDHKEAKILLHLRSEGTLTSELYLTVAAKLNEPVELIDLAPGRYVATIQTLDVYSTRKVLGQASVQVTEGEMTHCELLAEPPPPDEQAHLSGLLIVPSAWKLDSRRLNAGLRQAKLHGETPANRSKTTAALALEESWSFDFGELPLGEYKLQFTGKSGDAELGCNMTVVLEHGGLEGVRFEVAPPTTVVVRLLDSETGETAEISSIYWGPLGADDQLSSLGLKENLNVLKGEFEFRAPVGRLSLNAFGNGYESLDEIVHLGPHHNEFTYRLGRECPLQIRFLDGETPVPPPNTWWPTPKHLDGEGKLLYTRSGVGSGFTTALSKPGRYLFEIPDIEGFEPIPDQTITVKRGEETLHVVQLVREE